MTDAEVAEVLRENVALKAELTQLRRLMPEYLNGAIDQQAMAWQVVYNQCLAVGLMSHLDHIGQSAPERVASFIRKLASRAGGAAVPSR